MKKNSRLRYISLLSLLILVVLLSITNVLTSGLPFSWELLNPFDVYEGFIFTLSYGAGIPVTSAAIMAVMVTLLVFLAIDWVIRKIWK